MARGVTLQKGSSLIETIVAGTLLAVAVTGIYTVVSRGSWLTKETVLRRRAYQELERILETPAYANASYTLLPADGEPVSLGTVTLDTRGQGSEDDINAQATVTVDTLQYTVKGYVIPAKKITAKLEWIDEGQTKTADLSTVITLVDVN